MGDSIKSYGLKVLNLLICLFVFFIMALPLHEGGHSLAAQLLGCSGYIELDWFKLGGYFVPTDCSINSWQYIVIAFAGGGFVALLYGLLLVFANIGLKWDEDDQTALRMVLGMQLGYGIGEPVSDTIALAGLIVGLFGALVYSLPKLCKWWTNVT